MQPIPRLRHFAHNWLILIRPVTRDAFEEVERLAPGWFRCRSDIWLAHSLEEGSVSEEEFRLLRVLEDGRLERSEAMHLAQQAVQRHPEFAPFRLVLGDLQQDDGDSDVAIASYRAGLEIVEEPDLESRLLCALASALPTEASERPKLIDRAVHLKGSLVAQATARLLGVQ